MLKLIFMALYPRQNSNFTSYIVILLSTVEFHIRHWSFTFDICAFTMRHFSFRLYIGVTQCDIKISPCLHARQPDKIFKILAARQSVPFCSLNYYEFNITVLIVMTILYNTISEIFFSLCMFCILKEEISCVSII